MSRLLAILPEGHLEGEAKSESEVGDRLGGRFEVSIRANAAGTLMAMQFLGD
jgi:hypothetical protein